MFVMSRAQDKEKSESLMGFEPGKHFLRGHGIESHQGHDVVTRISSGLLGQFGQM